jgi:hypothetical protein
MGYNRPQSVAGSFLYGTRKMGGSIANEATEHGATHNKCKPVHLLDPAASRLIPQRNAISKRDESNARSGKKN